jgi:ACS family hexuronate transporter-like MFS transporter
MALPVAGSLPESVDPAAALVPRAGRWAWGVCWLMFASTVLNYMDRQAIALVSTQIQDEFRINNETFGWVLATFYLTYALWQLPAGHLADRVDVRRLYPGAVLWWSLAGIASAFAPSLGLLIACRAVLGAGESFNWPCALKATGRVLPPADRGLGNGIFNSGAAVGAVLTPLIVPLLTVRFGWRAAFVGVGMLGFLWALAWLWIVRGPSAAVLAPERTVDPLEPRPPRSNTAVTVGLPFGLLCAVAVGVGWLGYVRSGAAGIWLGVAVLMIGALIVARLMPLVALGTAGWARSLGEVVRRRRFWVLVLVTVSINICWHFLVGWLPKYLNTERKLTALVALVQPWVSADDPKRDATAAFLVSSVVTALVFLAADAGNLLGGIGSRRLVARGLRPAQARWRVMAVCVLAISAGAWVGRARNDYVAVALLAIMALGAAGFMANYFAFCQDVDTRSTGLIVGILGGMGNLFAAGILPFAGWVKDTTASFDPIFVLVGLSPFVGLFALAIGWGTDATTPNSHN